MALILCEVLRWQASEVAELLETSVPAVNSALQRARATMASMASEPLDARLDAAHEAMLTAYVDAFERYDMTSMISLLRADAVLSMPPWDLWVQGARDVVDWMSGQGAACEGSRLLPLSLNGTAAFASYKPGADGRLEPWAIQVIEVADVQLVGHHNFIFPELFAQLGLPPALEA